MYKIIALCPTYGRVTKLRQALAWWDAQTYSDRLLIILNDAPIRLACKMQKVRVVNLKERLPTLGTKRQYLLKLALEHEAKYVCHFDDDDIYLKWYVESLVYELESGAAAVKPEMAYVGTGPDDNILFKGPEANVFEAQLGFNLNKALEIGYQDKQVGETISMMNKLSDINQLKLFKPSIGWPMICRYADGITHASCLQQPSQFLRNRDFGDGNLLEPSDVSTIVSQIVSAGIPV